MRGLFVTGTDTGVGKTIVAAAIVAALSEAGEPVAAFKPAVTGTDEDPGEWPRDHELLAELTGVTPEAVTPVTFGPAVSPHLAAEIAGVEIDPAQLLLLIRAISETGRFVIAEGVGGLLVPLTPTYSIRDFAKDLGLPVVIAARPGLGTINHTLLTIEAARAAGLQVAGVVLTPWPASPTEIERSNAASIAALGEVEVAPLPHLPGPDPTALAAAGGSLPLSRWLAQ